MQPENLGPLAAALAKAQAEFLPIVKDRTVNTGTFTYAYAELDKVIEAVRPALAKNGLAFTQLLDGQNLVTMLIHESGAYLSGSVPIPQDAKVQAFGSAVTYYRRYALQAILGVAAEKDDDGGGADKNRPPQRDRVQDAVDEEQAAAEAYAREQAARRPQPVQQPPSLPQADIASLHARFDGDDPIDMVPTKPFTPDELADIEEDGIAPVGGMTSGELFNAAEAADVSKAILTLTAKTLFGVNRWKVTDLTNEERAQLWEEVAPVAV